MTTITSGGAGTISSAGIGSGLDVNAIVTKLMAVEQQPLTALQTAASGLQTQLSAFGQLQSAVSTLQDAAKPLYSADTYTLTNAGSTDSSTVSAGTTASAQAGTYTVAVSALSANQSVVSATGQYTDGTSVVGTGSITISIGAWNAGSTTFTPKSGSTDITIPISADSNTLAGIRDAINKAGAGVSATLVTDASGTRIALQSTASGVVNGFRVTVADDDGTNTDGTGLSSLAYDPANSVSQLTLAQSAANTQATINGISVSSTDNTLSNIVDGITFNVSKVTTTNAPVTVNVTRNTDAIKTRLTAFVAAYNQLNSLLTTATKYDPTTKTAALLQGDSTTTGIQNQLHSLLGQTSGASSTFSTLSSLGVQVQKDGTLSLNDTTFNAAVSTNLKQVTQALSNVDATVTANNGFGKKFYDWTDRLLSAGGTLPGKTASIQSRITSNQKDQDALNDRLTQIQARLQAQYTALDSTMASANALSAYVTQQITTWNKNTS